MNVSSGQDGDLRALLLEARKLLPSRPDLAEKCARQALAADPRRGPALLILAVALRLQSKFSGAKEILEKLARDHPGNAPVQFEFGLVLGRLGETRRAIDALSRAVQQQPGFGEAWKALADLLYLTGQTGAADDASLRYLHSRVDDPQLREAIDLLHANRPELAEAVLRDLVARNPASANALKLLAEALMRQDRAAEAEQHFQRCLALDPGFAAARQRYGMLLLQTNPAEALAQAETLLREDAGNIQYRDLKAAALSELGLLDEAIAIYEPLLASYPDFPDLWVRFGNALRIRGHFDRAVAAYRNAIALQPNHGEAYFSLANLKTFRFSPAEIGAMRQHLENTALAAADRVHFHFALGKALEDAGEHGEAFAHYEQGNAMHRAGLKYDPAATAKFVESCKEIFSPEFFAARAGSGAIADDPIFIVGLPRAGSTLIEQVLASHSMIEGTRELKEVGSIAAALGARCPAGYPAALRELGPGQLTDLGEEYLKRTRPFRRLNRPRFIDKMPNNFFYAGFIHLMLPQAKIIDVRRNPLDCCVSNFTQHFAQGQPFTYSLTDLGRYYSGYLDLMTHFDAVLPGRIHRVMYEEFVADPQGETRRLLAYLGLPFEENCLRFFETERPVRSASSEQVRQPVYREGIGRWRKFEPWLSPLKNALPAEAA